jgi:hypothetical protein
MAWFIIFNYFFLVKIKSFFAFRSVFLVYGGCRIGEEKIFKNDYMFPYTVRCLFKNSCVRWLQCTVHSTFKVSVNIFHPTCRLGPFLFSGSLFLKFSIRLNCCKLVALIFPSVTLGVKMCITKCGFRLKINGTIIWSKHPKIRPIYSLDLKQLLGHSVPVSKDSKIKVWIIEDAGHNSRIILSYFCPTNQWRFFEYIKFSQF